MTTVRLHCFIALACALFVAPSALGETFFEDDFEGYFDDFELETVGGWQVVDVNQPVENAAWTILNPGGRGNPAGEDGTPSDGVFLISDSDAAGGDNPTGSGMSHDIWSPAIDLAGVAGPVWLHFDCVAQLNNNGKAVFDVDVSTDEGDTWTNAFRRVAPSRTEAPPVAASDNSAGFFGRAHVDLGDFAGRDILIRWRHFEPNDDWWIAVDNVLVDDQAPSRGGDCNLLARTDFSGGFPEGWELRSTVDPANTGTETWHTTDKGQRSIAQWNGGNYPYQDGRGVGRLMPPFAILDSDADPDPAEDEWLVTPTIDCSEAEDVFLHYNEEIVATGATQEVLLSIDGGSTFEPVPIFSFGSGAGFDPGEEPFFAERVLTVPAASFESEVVFAFHYASGGDEWYWAVDDVRVSARLAGGANCPCTCTTRGFASGGFDPRTGEVDLVWNRCDADAMHRVIRNGVVAAELPAASTAYADGTPPANQVCPLSPDGPATNAVYFLESVDGAGNVLTRCGPICLEPRRCPSGLLCCLDRDTGIVSLSWEAGINVSGSSWRIRRNGLPRTSLALTATSYSETPPGPGVWEYTLELNGGDVAQCPDLPLYCTVVVPTPEILLFEDFDCYASDEEVLAAGWEMLLTNEPVADGSEWHLGASAGQLLGNRCGRGAPPTENGTPSQGKFLISDNDCGGVSIPQGSGQSYDLVSPRFSASAAAAVWLHLDMTAVLNNNGEVVVDIDVSSDGGVEWTNVFRRIGHDRGAVEPFPQTEFVADDPVDFDSPVTFRGGNMDGVFGRVHIDLSEVALGESNVRFRVRHFEPNFDWWVAVDNVVVDTVPALGGNTTLLGPEGFDDGEVPEDWEAETLSGDGFATWQFAEAGSFCAIGTLNSTGGQLPDGAAGRALHWFDRNFALAAFDAQCSPQPQDELLSTPSIDCSNATSVFLHVRSAFVFVGQRGEILLSLDGGETFDVANPLFSYDRQGGFSRDGGNAEVAYNDYVFAVPAAVGAPDVVFGFHILKIGAGASWWAIDDVEVTGDVAGGRPGFRRGDTNGNGTLDLTDAVSVFNFLFLGGPAPGCRAAADSSGQGDVNLTSGVYTLNFLFLGGAPPPAPFATCGPSDRPSDERLGCATPHC